MQFRTVADLNRRILASLDRFPRDIDVVIGIPRSGMMAGSLVSLATHLPLADVEGFVDGRLLSSGHTRTSSSLLRTADDCNHALVVDDSIATGDSMRGAMRTLESAWPGKRFTYCAIFGQDRDPDFPVLILERVRQPRFFEWNIMHHSLLAHACVDIDGVLCHDPTHEENDDGAEYLNFLTNARPLYTPRCKIGALVTSRLERYRSQTAQWLTSHGIEYDQLIMLDLPNAETRRRMGAHGSFKGKYYRSSSARLFIESELAQAIEIAKFSGKPVLCMEGPQLVQPDQLSLVSNVQKVRSGPRVFAQKHLRRLVGDANYHKLKTVILRR